MTCAVIGDSIAVDLGRALPECATHAKIGIGSAAIVAYVVKADLTVISAGSNDPLNPVLEHNLETIRAGVASQAMWILPINPRARAIVAKVAMAHGDLAFGFAPAGDNVHPRSAAPMARAIRAAKTPLDQPCNVDRYSAGHPCKPFDPRRPWNP